MKIGLTYDLRSWYLDRGYSMEDTAEFDKQETVDAIDEALRKMGFETEQAGNCFQLIEALAAGRRWDLVFNIAEGLYGDGRESVVPAILDQYRIPYVFSGPVIMGICLNKHLTRVIVSSAGIPVSPGLLVSNITDLKDCRLNYPLFIKPVSEGTGKGITEKSVINNQEELYHITEALIEKHKQPMLLEEYLPGREFTVGIVGSGLESAVIGGMEIQCRDNLPYSVELKENYQEFCRYIPMDGILRTFLVQLPLMYGRRRVDAGRVDVKVDRTGKICFMEVNPLAGLHPVHSDLPILASMAGINYQSLIEMIMESCLKRYNIIP